jgi:hypothetical protein
MKCTNSTIELVADEFFSITIGIAQDKVVENKIEVLLMHTSQRLLR